MSNTIHRVQVSTYARTVNLPLHVLGYTQGRVQMPIDEIRARVKKTIAKVCGLKAEQIGDQDTFDSLEIDSLARIEMLVELEREFKLSIPDEEEDANLMNDFQSIDNAIAMVQKNLAVASA